MKGITNAERPSPALGLQPNEKDNQKDDDVPTALKKQELTLNMGPQHPSTHGVFRMILDLDGETIVDAQSVIGYLHRGTEKLAEGRTYQQNIPFTDRLDYTGALCNNHAYVLSCEKLGGVEVPERARYLRVIFTELSRIAAHLIAVGTFASDAGAYFTPMIYGFRERELILDMFEMTCGQRLTPSYFRIGGVSREVPDEFLPALRYFLGVMPKALDEFETLLTKNEIFIARTRNVGVIPAALAVNYSITGPCLRASGVRYDMRRVTPYEVYDRFDFDIPTRTNGDAYDRYLVRVLEMRQSLRIVEQALRDLPEGEFRAKMSRNFRPPAGDAYVRVEAAKGELGFYLVSDGSLNPYRFRIRPPSFINVGILPELLIGHKIADAVVILGSLDIVMGEVDR